MNFLLDNWYLVLLALASGGMLLWPTLRGGLNAGAIPATEAVRLINREKAVLIDVCEPAEYAAGHAAGAKNAPLATLASSRALPSNKTLPLIVVCATGARASRAVPVLQKLGHQHVHVLAGGNRAWREANLPTDKSA